MPTLPPDVAKTLKWVADGVAVIEPPPGEAGATSMLIEDGDVVLVDAGIGAREREMLRPHVDVLILTHCHPRHVRGVSDFAEVWAPRAEARALRGPADFCETFGVSRRDGDLVMEWLEAREFGTANVRKAYRPGGLVKLDRHEWRLLAAPGHSPGLTLLHDPKRHILYCSDLDGSEHSTWYGWPASDIDDLETTALDLAKVDVAILVGAHAPPRRRGIRPMFRSIAQKIQDRERRLLQTLRDPLTLDEIVARIQMGDHQPTTPIDHYFERVMAEKHLHRLLAKEHVGARQDGRYEWVR